MNLEQEAIRICNQITSISWLSIHIIIIIVSLCYQYVAGCSYSENIATLFGAETRFVFQALKANIVSYTHEILLVSLFSPSVSLEILQFSLPVRLLAVTFEILNRQLKRG